MKTVEEHLRKFVSALQTNLDDRLPVFLLAYITSTRETRPTLASVVFGRELRLPCELLCAASPDEEQSTTDNLLGLLHRRHSIHHCARQHLNVTSDRIKVRYDRLANSSVFTEGDQVWLYRPTRTSGKSPELQPSWKVPKNVITWINDVVDRIRLLPRAKMMAVHLER